MITCELCGRKFEDTSEFKKHLKLFHCTNYPLYVETVVALREVGTGKEEFPLTTIFSDDVFFIPENNSKRNSGKAAVLSEIEHVYERVQEDEILRTFLSDTDYRKYCKGGFYNSFRDTLLSTVTQDFCDNNIFTAEAKLGYGGLFDPNYPESIKIKECPKTFSIDGSEVTVGAYKIQQPEVVNYDFRHHSRSNLLSVHSSRKTKRFRLPYNPAACFKLTPRGYLGNSIFRVIGPDGYIANPSEELHEVTLTNLRTAIFRTDLLDCALCVILHTLKKSKQPIKYFKDSVILRNTIEVEDKKDGILLNFSWEPEEIEENDFGIDPGRTINISIL